MVIDDLRDYRFYKEDMLHPNSVAVDYIWSGFKESFLEDNTIELSNEINKLVVSSKHKALKPDTVNHQKFLLKQLDQIEQLLKKNPSLNFTQEIDLFKKQLLD